MKLLIIPVYNEKNTINLILQKYSKLNFELKKEIIIVDFLERWNKRNFKGFRS